METGNATRIGAVTLLTGLILMLVSWNLSYPIHMPEKVDALTFTQFHPLIWPGIMLSLTGLFLTGYYSRKKSIKIICVSLFPMVLYSYAFFFSYTPTSDSGAVKAMFEVFHQTGINPVVEPYFHYPVFFTLSEMTAQTLGLNPEYTAALLFLLFGVLLATYLFLFMSKLTKDNSYQTAFFGALLYFTALYFHLNYQWVPQTLALVFLVLLLFLFNQKKIEYKVLTILVFTTLVFTHLFIPAIFLLFLGIYSIKKKEFRNAFLLMTCIYVSVLVYYATFYLSTILEAFRRSVYGFGGEYLMGISRSFMEPGDLISWTISMVNRIRIPLTWIILSIGFLIGFVKKKIGFAATTLAFTGGVYLALGLFYPILGLRALQILFIPLVIGAGFLVSKWRKPALVFVTILLILAVFGPMRSAYDTLEFQLKEEENACGFLATTIPMEQTTVKVAIPEVNLGYLEVNLNYVYWRKSDYADPSIFRYNDIWWLFVGEADSSRCQLYYSEDLTDPFSWVEHPCSPIATDKSKARPGGRTILLDNGRILRFAQKCDVTYGEMVRAFEVDTLTKTAYAEHEILQSPLLQPGDNGWSSCGMHTFDPWWTGDRWLCAVDGKDSHGRWSIGIYTTSRYSSVGNQFGAEMVPDWYNVPYEPFPVDDPQEIVNPVLTADDITDKEALYVADPFIFHENGSDVWYMFFEVEDGVSADIGVATSTDGLNWKYDRIILDTDFHKSYPMVFKYKGVYYMIPECEPNYVKLYKSEPGEFPYRWSFVANLLGGRSYVGLTTPKDRGFDYFLKGSIGKNRYILYNPKLAKEMISCGIKREDVNDFEQKIILNNKIYICNKTFIIKGR